MRALSSAQACRQRAGLLSLAAMTGRSGKSGDPKRTERLKAALRENLKRRKAQEKARVRAAKGRDFAGITSEIAQAKPKR
jgi:hypothetical protein